MRRSVALTWGSTPAERRGAYPCDPLLPDADAAYFRAVDVSAPAPTVFRWLCQLKLAPYSYDWIDNFGRRSPRRLVPGAENLAPGQRVMTIFGLVAFEEERHLTVALDLPRAVSVFGRVAMSYVVSATSEGSCRLVAKINVRYPTKPPWSFVRWILPWGDLVMMRKQLLTLKRLSESQARLAGRPEAWGS
ncbi:hypothetical protein GBA65_03020 [Rubrobacter marinus]|uniref:Polyketide cyclase / dehydrase and lipid transport n=1 Tax=Rubrobacter marinus TaxID=2653852 RepID=A0A6G8PUG2_9ACTN|nr:hypothetical protein [Rubrobacter marinus]QIN77646.1 hypothetical protein GBA65_03020 [Rubrobacter marinus]